MSLDFAVPEEGESYKTKDKSRVTVGGTITTVTRKIHKAWRSDGVFNFIRFSGNCGKSLFFQENLINIGKF